jgi:hypothetical protein
MGNTQSRTAWREEKRQRTLSITDTGWQIATTVSDLHHQNRSEVIEVLLRYAHRENLDLHAIRTSLLTPTTSASARA